MRSIIPTVLLIIFFSLFFNLALAQPQVDTKTADEIIGITMSPFCPGRLLPDCPTEAAAGLKTEIRNEIAAGKSKEDVILNLKERFGEQIIALPSLKGVGLLAYGVPIIFLLLGASTLLRWVLTSNKNRN